MCDLTVNAFPLQAAWGCPWHVVLHQGFVATASKASQIIPFAGPHGVLLNWCAPHPINVALDGWQVEVGIYRIFQLEIQLVNVSVPDEATGFYCSYTPKKRRAYSLLFAQMWQSGRQAAHVPRCVHYCLLLIMLREFFWIKTNTSLTADSSFPPATFPSHTSVT